MKSKGEFNLQNHGLNLQQSNIKEEEETYIIYIIPSIINGQIPRKDTSMAIKQRTSLQKRVKLSTSEKTVMSA